MGPKGGDLIQEVPLASVRFWASRKMTNGEVWQDGAYVRRWAVSTPLFFGAHPSNPQRAGRMHDGVV